VEFQIFSDTLNIINVLPGGPSDKAGLKIGDQMVRVNDSINIAGKKLESENIRKLLRGKKGTDVKVTVLRNKKLIPITITRDKIPLISVDAAYMITPQTGFIHINRFAETTYREFMETLEKLQAKGMKKLILDLRGNGGGLLGQAVNIADEFLDENKLIVYTLGTHVPKYEYNAKREGLFETGELAIIVDEGSASASEVLSGALQDWDRATIIGRRTFGKGLVQEQFSLSDGSALRLTVARYFTPLGRNIQKPYNVKDRNYDEEVYQRFHNGEVVKADTAKKGGKQYRTKKGRIVYGGGGITPDVFVAYDTTAMSAEAVKLYRKGIINNFIYTLYIKNQEKFAAYKTPNALVTSYTAGETEWSALKTFAAKDTVNLSLVNPKDKADIIKRIPSLIARLVWRYQGYYEVMNANDDAVKKALEIVK
jgi:carboxyl-terminal processing protease